MTSQQAFKLFSAPYVVFLGIIIPSAPQLAWGETSFNHEIRPILSKHCIACHGPDEGNRKAGFRLDTFEGVTADLGGYQGIAPGDPAASEILARITSDDPYMRMPPADHAAALSAAEIGSLRKWIAEGAEYETHWSFVPPVKPAVPMVSANDFEGTPFSPEEWGINEIDLFVLEKLRSIGLPPRDAADPYRLIRRLALDLTGLPASQQQIESFANDPSLENYERVVDELLQSPRYGEHWAAMWLDLARYADSIGYSGDENRTIWPWRDWLIRSLNTNLPYDQFTTEMLAGDLLPNATQQQRLATAFHRNTLNNTEGGTDDEEFRTIAVKDRISTTVNVWMGLTMRCAECHTHKYDPISQTEYYQFLDFFNQTVDSDKRDDRPNMDYFPPEREAEFKAAAVALERKRKELEQQPEVWQVLKPIATESREETEFEIQPDDSILAAGPNPQYDEFKLTFQVPPGRLAGLRLEAIPDKRNGGYIGRGYGGGFIITQVRAELNGESIELADAEADHSAPNMHIKHTIRKKIAETDVDKKGWAVNHPEEGYKQRREGIFTLAQPIEIKEPTELTFHILHKGQWPGLNVGRVRLSSTAVENPAKKYRNDQLDSLRREIVQLEKLLKNPIRVPIMEDRPEGQERQTHVMVRGSFRQPGERVSAAVPAAFHALPEGVAANRLGVAKWITSEKNPLTARVAVNRYWARLFGKGLVESEEDFGTQGTLPSHPELLDWLAVEFRENGWDVKRLLKTMVMSATYRQDSQITEQSYELDPLNAFLSRGPRYRLSAEVVRDQALAVTGLLSPKLYGPPVYPPNPIKRVVNAFTGGTDWKESEGEDRYRRAVYTYLKRSSPHPLFDTFDMATRDVCSIRRMRTNTPLQSFMTLNDPAFVEAAQALAKQMHRVGDAGSSTVNDQIAYGLETALGAPAEQAEVDQLAQLYEVTLDSYELEPENALKMSGLKKDEAGTGEAAELAALTVTANVILNLDAFLTR